MNNQPEHFEYVCQFVQANLGKWQIPGLALGVYHQGEVAVMGFGVTNADHPLPVTDETLFQVGSVTKTFVGTAVMRLVEVGKLALDATVQTYLPGFRVRDETASAQATLRHLLTHTCGWAGDVFRNTGAGDDALARYVAGMANLDQLAPVGTLFSYNNAAFSVLGRIIEIVTGKTFEAALSELVLTPLGLENTYIFPADVMTRRFVVGHRVTNGVIEVARPWPLERSSHAQGGIICDIRDILRYARFHLGDGTDQDGNHLLAADSLAQMQSPQVTIWNNEYRGITWNIRDSGGERQVMHSGGTKGQTCQLTLLPAHQFAIAVLTNAEEGSVAIGAVTQQALRHYLGMIPPETKPQAADPADMAAFAGFYSRPFADLELGMVGGRLIGLLTYKLGFPNEETPPSPAPPPMTIGQCEADRLLVLDGAYKGATIDVLRREDGTIGWLRLGGRLYVRHPRL